MTFRIPAFPFPKEHGAWAVAFVPFAVGTVLAGRGNLETSALFVAVLGAFLASGPVRSLFRNDSLRARRSGDGFWAAVLLSCSALFGAILVSRGHWYLLAIAGLAIMSFLGTIALNHRRPLSPAGDLIAVPGLTLTGPAAYALGVGTLDARAGMLWLIFVLFFASGFVYVHMHIRAAAVRKDSLSLRERLTAGRINLAYHGAAVALLLGLFRFDVVPFAAFVPMFLHAVAGTFFLSPRPRFKRLGLILVGHSIVFALLLTTMGFGE